MKISSEVGQQIQRLRKTLGLRQKTLARMVGVSAGALTNFENGRRRISLDRLQKISEALDTPVAYLLGDGRARKKVGDPRERRVVKAWRRLRRRKQLRGVLLQLMKDFAGR